jgi:hypothetical protein
MSGAMASSGATQSGAREQPWEQSRSRDNKRAKDFVAAVSGAVGA